MKDVIAWRNGIRKVFTARQWDILGTDKYGWVAEPETPKEVVRELYAQGSVPEPEPEISAQPKQIRKSRK